ncbi:hypothetical protein OU995_05840 [Roseateles sp. SL47]|nr:hypothetical protein OU995_05840 [Roseateles sp. SL47]
MAAVLKEWVRCGVVVPVSGPQGSGNHAVYDDANLIAVGVACHFRELGVPLTRFAGQFQKMHAMLRGCSSLEWRGQYIVFSVDGPALVRFDALGQIPDAAIVLNLDELAVRLVPVDSDPQIPLKFGVSSVTW